MCCVAGMNFSEFPELDRYMVSWTVVLIPKTLLQLLTDRAVPTSRLISIRSDHPQTLPRLSEPMWLGTGRSGLHVKFRNLALEKHEAGLFETDLRHDDCLIDLPNSHQQGQRTILSSSRELSPRYRRPSRLVRTRVNCS